MKGSPWAAQGTLEPVFQPELTTPFRGADRVGFPKPA